MGWRFIIQVVVLAAALVGCGGDSSDSQDVAARLYLRDMQDEWEIGLSRGDSLTMGGESYRVEAIRPWRGLLRMEDGRRMVSFSAGLERGDWEEDIFLAEGEWARIGSSLSVGLYWWASEEEARRGAARPIEETPSARWGIRDATKIHWFSAFDAGAGVTRQDGVDVTLLGHSSDTEPPIIVVMLDDGDSRSRAIIAVETHAAGAPAIYENAALREHVIVLHGWRDGSVVAAYYRDGEKVDARLLESGESWEPGVAMRLEQALGQGAPVTEEASELWEVVLSTATRRFRVREAELARIGEVRVRVAVSEGRKLRDAGE